MTIKEWLTTALITVLLIAIVILSANMVTVSNDSNALKTSISALSLENDCLKEDVKEEYSKGYEQGKADGYRSGESDGYDKGKSDGYEDGKNEGYNNGYSKGFEDGKSSVIIPFTDVGATQEIVTRSAPVQETVPEPVQEPTAETVYVTKSGKKYHRDGCSYLKSSKIPKSKDDAIAAGYTPCSRCNP